MEGTIVKGIGGFYYVKTTEGTIECKARGKFRHTDLTPMVGDKVEITVKNNKGVIEKIFERASELIRPYVSNVTQAFVIFTFANPELNLDLLNRFLVLCESNNINAVICFNKIDLINIEEYKNIIEMFEKAGYDIVYLKAKEGYGIDQLEEKLKDNITVFCGPSGSGKSTLLNALTGSEVMKTGIVSEKVGRGKHTTRHSELVEYGSGFIVDTPGFSSLDISYMEKEELQKYFPEFDSYVHQCKFTGCMHNKEPQCAVKAAVEENEISPLRYNFYINILEELQNGRNKKW